MTAVIVTEKKREILRAMVTTLKLETELDTSEGMSTEDFVFDIVESILSAETEEEIFDAQEAGSESGKEFIDRPFFLTEDGLTFRRSMIPTPGSLPFYAMMDITEISTGEEHVVSCGGISVVSVLFSLRAKEFLNAEKYPTGKPLVLIGKSTAAGYTRLEIRPYRLPEVKPSGKTQRKG